MSQELFNIAIALCSVFGGWWMKSIHETLKELKSTDEQLGRDFTELKVLVAGQYVRQDQLKALFDKLDRIEDKLDQKADK